MSNFKNMAIGVTCLIAGAIYFYQSGAPDLKFSSARTLSNHKFETSLVLIPDTIYVDSAAMGANDGSSWLNAFNNLQIALAAAAPCDTIFVAQGTYYPSLSDRNISFNLPDSTVIMGGFPSFGAGPRNATCNKTVLSGEFQGDTDPTNNSFHVVTTFSTTNLTVDGFVITGGYASSPPNGDNRYGGGWFNRGLNGDSSEPVIVNCVITGNRAIRGGGMANYGDLGATNPILINCILSNNVASTSGGAVFNYGAVFGSSPTLINCIVSGNQAALRGGAIYNDGDDGGLSRGNYTNCVFNGNASGQLGGAFFNTGSGGICANTFTNCIFWNNIASFDGPVFWNEDCNPYVSYSIIQAGGGPPGNINDPSITEDGGNGSAVDGGNNKFGAGGYNPQFINAPAGASAPTAAGDFHVPFLSPAIDMGFDMANNHPTDLGGDTRIFNDSIDIGAYEFSGLDCADYVAGVVYVDSAATGGLNNGTSWANAFTDLQDCTCTG